VSSPASAQYGTFVPKTQKPTIPHTASPSAPTSPTSKLPFTGANLAVLLTLALLLLALGIWVRVRAQR
jgi:hypothetical protein